MNRKTGFQSAFFNPRVLVPLVLLLGGTVLGMFTMSAQVRRSSGLTQLKSHRVGIDSSAAQAGATPTPCAVLAYIVNDISNNVSVVDTSNNTVVATMPLPGNIPNGVAVKPDGTRAYVTCSGSNSVVVIDTLNNTVMTTVDLPAPAQPQGVAVTPDGTRAYVANLGTNTVSVIDTSSNTVVATVGVGFPRGVAINPDGTHAYVTRGSFVAVIDTSTNTVVHTITVGSGSWGLAVNPAGTRVYVANEDSNNVSVIDTSNNTVMATVPVGSVPYTVAVTPDGTRAYVTNGLSNTVSVIDTSNNTVVATVAVGTSPAGVAVTPDGARAYVANSGFNENGYSVSVIDTSNNTVIATVPVGTGPISLGNFIAAVPCSSPTPTPTTTPTPSPKPCQPFRVLIIYADTPVPAQFQYEIQTQPNVAAVDLFDAQNGTPTLAQLQEYDIVVPLSQLPFQDPDALGNNLADYVDAGGIVVQYGFSFNGPDSPFGVNGRWVTGDYSPYNYSRSLLLNTPFTLGSFNAAHPLMAGVNTLTSNAANVVVSVAEATPVAWMNNGSSLVASRQVSGGHATVGVTAYVGDSAVQSGDWGKVVVNAGKWLLNCQVSGTPTPIPTPSPTCTPREWQFVANMPLDLYGAAGASDATYFYAAGGYSFSLFPEPGTVNSLYRWSPDPSPNGSWTILAPMPQAVAVATAVYYPPTNKIYIFGGGDADTGECYNITQIYDIPSNTWTIGASMPDVRGLSAGGYIPATGQIYVISGCATIADLTTAQPNTWAYDPVTNSWSDLTGAAPFPHPADGFAYGVINNKLYIAGGHDANNQVINLTWEYDPVENAYKHKADEPGAFQNNVPGSAVANGLLWVFGGGNPFTGVGGSGFSLPSTRASSDPNKAAFPRAVLKGVTGQALPTTANSGRYYDPASNTWASSPDMLAARSFPSGGAIGDRLLIAAGGFNGSLSIASVQKETICIEAPAPSPTITPTPSATPRHTPTPRPRPTPLPR